MRRRLLLHGRAGNLREPCRIADEVVIDLMRRKSSQRACLIIKADRKSVRYRSCRPPDTALRERLRTLAVERRRFGYRQLFVLLRRDGEPSDKNRIYRLYREEGLTVRKRRSRRRAIGTRPLPHSQRGRRRHP